MPFSSCAVCSASSTRSFSATSEPSIVCWALAVHVNTAPESVPAMFAVLFSLTGAFHEMPLDSSSILVFT